MRTIGLDHEQIDGALKELPCSLLCGKSPRYAMQTLGTEWRDMIGKELWANITCRGIREYLRHGGGMGGDAVVVDDLRFPHEETALHALASELGVSCQVWLVDRPGRGSDGHASEKPELLRPDWVVPNHGSLSDLERTVAKLMNRGSL